MDLNRILANLSTEVESRDTDYMHMHLTFRQQQDLAILFGNYPPVKVPSASHLRTYIRRNYACIVDMPILKLIDTAVKLPSSLRRCSEKWDIYRSIICAHFASNECVKMMLHETLADFHLEADENPKPLFSALPRLPEKIPQGFVCPISQEIMSDPVVGSDGHTYERRCIELWLSSHRSSPLTKVPMRKRTLRPNWALRNLISDFIKTHENLIEEKCASEAK